MKKRDVLLAYCGLSSEKQHNVSLKEFAQALAEMTDAEIQELAKIMKEEYGLEANPIVLEAKPKLPDVSLRNAVLKKSKKERPYVPKKIGKVCKKPGR